MLNKTRQPAEALTVLALVQDHLDDAQQARQSGKTNDASDVPAAEELAYDWFCFWCEQGNAYQSQGAYTRALERYQQAVASDLRVVGFPEQHALHHALLQRYETLEQEGPAYHDAATPQQWEEQLATIVQVRSDLLERGMLARRHAPASS